jgi:hypothetical protein
MTSGPARDAMISGNASACPRFGAVFNRTIVAGRDSHNACDRRFISSIPAILVNPGGCAGVGPYAAYRQTLGRPRRAVRSVAP